MFRDFRPRRRLSPAFFWLLSCITMALTLIDAERQTPLALWVLGRNTNDDGFNKPFNVSNWDQRTYIYWSIIMQKEKNAKVPIAKLHTSNIVPEGDSDYWSPPDWPHKSLYPRHVYFEFSIIFLLRELSIETL